MFDIVDNVFVICNDRISSCVLLPMHLGLFVFHLLNRLARYESFVLPFPLDMIFF